MIKYILLILFFASCSLEFSNEKESWDKGTINNENAISISHDGLSREYVLNVPDSYNGIDSFLFYDNPEILLWLNRGEVYSRLLAMMKIIIMLKDR